MQTARRARRARRVRSPSGLRALLSAADFTYLGYYPIASSVAPAGGAAFSIPITHRTVGGELRFLIGDHQNSPYTESLVEFTLPAGGYGTTITSAQRTNSWPYTAMWLPGPEGNYLTGYHFGYWFEDDGGGTGSGRLWTTQGVDYPGLSGGFNYANATFSVCVRSLTAGGTMGTVLGPWGFQGVNHRRVMWKVARNPSWVQSQYSLGPYLYGFGGYSSLLSQGGAVSTGLYALAGPDVSTYPAATLTTSTLNGTGADWTVPTADFKIVADHVSGSDSVDSGFPTTKDRGWRASAVKSFYDADLNLMEAGGLPSNGTASDATVEAWYAAHDPASYGGVWLNPGPDGHNRWTWGDTYGSSGTWVDGANGYGFVTVGAFTGTWGGYTNSALDSGSCEVEIHVFDPADFGAVAAGTKHAWNVQPVAMKVVTADFAAQGGALPRHQNAGIPSCPGGATYDPITGKLYVFVPGLGGTTTSGLFVYGVNA